MDCFGNTLLFRVMEKLNRLTNRLFVKMSCRIIMEIL